MTYSNVTIGVAETQGPRGGHHFVKNSESVTSVGSDSSSNTAWLVAGGRVLTGQQVWVPGQKSPRRTK